jgi:glutamate/aspartate transport system permease protein
MGSWDWQVFCRDTTTSEVTRSCFGSGGDITYLQWMLSAWGWTLSVAGLSLVVALVLGSIMGILRTVPHRGLVFAGSAWTEWFRNIPLLVQVTRWRSGRSALNRRSRRHDPMQRFGARTSRP